MDKIVSADWARRGCGAKSRGASRWRRGESNALPSTGFRSVLNPPKDFVISSAMACKLKFESAVIHLHSLSQERARSLQ